MKIRRRSVTEERVGVEDVEMGDVDKGKKECVYEEKEWHSNLEQGLLQPEGPSNAFIHDLEKVIGKTVMTYVHGRCRSGLSEGADEERHEHSK